MKRKCSMILLLALLVSLLVLPAQAAELGYVTDAAGLLTDTEWETLETLCDGTAAQYGCGVYIITVEDFRDLGSGDVFEVAYSLYHSYELGKGSDHSGILLLLSMAERDYATFVYGDTAEEAFGAYAQVQLEEQFLPPLGNNDWYGGLKAYAETCSRYLALAAAGEPVRGSAAGPILVCIAVSFLIALVVVLILRSGMKNVRKETQANRYFSGQLNLTRRNDQFTHKTESRRKIQTSSGSGSTSRSGGGGSGRSGKF